MAVKHVDCIIITMLMEERLLFLKDNISLIYNKHEVNNEYLNFVFFDKNNILRTGVFCSGNDKMGNTEACSLFYSLSRKYKADLYINVGVVGYINDVSIGDVIIVNSNYSLSERNDSLGHLQKTDIKLEDKFIEKTTNEINNLFSSEFHQISEKRLKKLKEKVNEYIENNSIDKQISENLNTIIAHNNEIKLGSCATYHSVVKDERTRSEIKKIRKTNIVDMESYYFNQWHSLIKTLEPSHSCQKSQMLMIKSVSDTALDKEKEILEKCNSREFAMKNIYDVVSFLITSQFTFRRENKSQISLYEFFREKISNKHIDRFACVNPFLSVRFFDELCFRIIDTKQIGDIDINGKYVQVCCDLLCFDKSTLVIQGSEGKGKSTLISFIYQTIENKKAVLFNLSRAVSINDESISVEQSLYLLKRLIDEEKEIVILIDGIENSYSELSLDSKRLRYQLLKLLKDCRNICICVGGNGEKYGHDKRVESFLPEGNEPYKIVFRSVNAFDERLEDFIERFADLYSVYDSSFNKERYTKKVLSIVENSKNVLHYIDFRLLYMFAKDNNDLSICATVFEFIREYCNKKCGEDIKPIYDQINNIILDKTIEDTSGLLTKNIYARAFLFSEYLFDAFYNNNEDTIRIILENDFVLSDNISSFVNIKLKENSSKTRVFVHNVIHSLNTSINCCSSSKTLLLYILGFTIEIIDDNTKEIIKQMIKGKLDTIKNNKDDTAILERRTLSIIMSRYFSLNDYLDRFIEEMLRDSSIMKLNINFHLLYYSQKEFSYEMVGEISCIDSEIVYNTYKNLKYYIFEKNEGLVSNFQRMCVYSLIYLIYYLLTDTEKYKKCAAFTPKNIHDLVRMIEKDFASILNDSIIVSVLNEIKTYIISIISSYPSYTIRYIKS